jgi:hypothetical protein
VLPPPSTPGACAPCAWDHEEPATGVAARVPVAFATATRLPAPLHPLSSAPARGVGTKARGLDPGSIEPGPDAARRLLQPTRPASTTAGSTDPRLVCERAGLTCARALRSPRSPASARSREGRGPFATSPPRSSADRFRRSFTDPPRSCTEHGQRRLLSPPLARGRSPAPPVKAKAATSRGFTGQGPAACAAGLPSQGLPCGRPLVLPFDSRRGGRYPNPIRSDTSRRGDRGTTGWRGRPLPGNARVGACPLRSHHVSPRPREG